MATTTFTISHERASDFAVASNARLPQVISRMMNFLQGGVAGNFAIESIELSQDQATGTVTLSDVGGVAASGSYALSGVGGTAATGSYALSNVGGAVATGTVTLAGSADDVDVSINGVPITTVPAEASDIDTATEVVANINGVGIFGGVEVAASNVGGTSAVVTIVTVLKGDAQNVTLVSSAAVGTATASGATLTGGLDGGVTVVINGTSVGPVNTTNLTDTAAATAVAAAIELNGTIGPLLAAVGSTANVNLTWGANGTAGNAITLAAGVSATGTATRSGATFSGGAQGSVGTTINGTLVTTDTTNLTDTAAATAVAAAIELDGTLGPLLAAVGSTTNVNLTWGVKGTVGNAITLAAGTSATGTATRSGATLTGGAQNTVTVTVGGEAVATGTTTLSDGSAATTIAAALNANATIADYVTATALSGVITLTALAAGEEGNGISLVAAAINGTATASGATLSGGSSTTHTR